MNQLPSNYTKWLRHGLTIVLIITLISSGILVFSSIQTESKFKLSAMDYRGLILALLAMVASWSVETYRIRLIAISLNEKISFKQMFRINLASSFMGNITPFASGGAPTQIYLLCQTGIQAGKASAIVTLRMIFSALVFTTLVPVLLIFYRTQLSFGWMHQLTTIAIPLSLVLSLLLITFIVKPKFAKNLLVFPLWICKSTRFKSKLEPYLYKFLKQVAIFHHSVKHFRKKSNFLLVIIASFFYWLCAFSIAPFLIYSFGLWGPEIFLRSILIQFILTFVMSYIPIPGGSGVMELGFFSMFVFIPIQIRALIVLIWRFLSYHMCTFVGGVILIRLINHRPPRPSPGGLQG